MTTRGRTCLVPDTAQDRQTIHLGHFDVQRDHIGVQLRDALECDGSVRRRPDHFQGGVFRQRVRHQAADDYRIVHHQHANARARRDRFPGECLCSSRPYWINPIIRSLSARISLVNGFITYSSAPAASAFTIWSTSVSVVTIMTFTDA